MNPQSFNRGYITVINAELYMPKSWTFNDKDDSPDQEQHDLTLYVTKGVTGVYVGHLKEMPEILVQADSEEKLAYEAKESASFYWKNFPEVHDKLYPKHIPASTSKGNFFSEKLQLKMIEVSMPQF